MQPAANLFCAESKDITATVEQYQKDAEGGDAQAQFKLAECLAKGVARDDEKANGWYRKAAEGGHAKAQCILGTKLIGTDIREGVKWLKKAAGQHDTAAMVTLANLLREGRDVIEKEESEAINWYKKAADLGNLAAKFQLVRCYLLGIATVKDQNEALKYFEQLETAEEQLEAAKAKPKDYSFIMAARNLMNKFYNREEKSRAELTDGLPEVKPSPLAATPPLATVAQGTKVSGDELEQTDAVQDQSSANARLAPA